MAFFFLEIVKLGLWSFITRLHIGTLGSKVKTLVAFPSIRQFKGRFKKEESERRERVVKLRRSFHPMYECM